MITAIVLIHVAPNRIPQAAQEIADIEGVSEVYSVAGGIDLIAIVRVREFDHVADVVAARGGGEQDGRDSEAERRRTTAQCTDHAGVPPRGEHVGCDRRHTMGALPGGSRSSTAGVKNLLGALTSHFRHGGRR